MEQFQNVLLPDYSLLRKRGRREGREFVFVHKNDQPHKNLFIRVGIHPTADEVKEVIYELNSWTSIVPQKDTTLGIGDQLWWMPAPYSPDTVQFHFIRNNVFISVNSHTLEYDELLNITKSIDDAILKKKSYISFSQTSEPPVIKSISSSRLKIKEGEEATITVNAYDPDNEDLEYIYYGVAQVTLNKFRFFASRDYVSEPFIGNHTLKFYVINESNFVSQKKEIEIEITN